MHLLTFATDGAPQLGVRVDDTVYDISGRPTLPGTMIELLAGGTEALNGIKALLDSDSHNLEAHPADAITYLPPVPNPQKIVCVGKNYADHASEMGDDAPEIPILFAKLPNVLVGHNHPVPHPGVSDTLDYEAELAVVIGQPARNISEDDALSIVAGYTCFNDLSLREYQMRTPQWLQGKSWDATGPCGPVLVTADEIADPNALAIATRVNGETLQESNTAHMIFNVPTLIAFISRIMTLQPGDIIATGTPPGVGAARTPQRYLSVGEAVEIEVEGLGVLRNTIVAG